MKKHSPQDLKTFCKVYSDAKRLHSAGDFITLKPILKDAYESLTGESLCSGCSSSTLLQAYYDSLELAIENYGGLILLANDCQ